MQERFQSLLKQRLLLEYEKRPPLFPWETEVSEYPAEILDLQDDELIASVALASPLWNAHVRTLKVPSLLPASLLNTLFARCQEIALSPVKQGVRLVRAVEDLFPDQAEILEPIADMVLIPAYRSDAATQEAVVRELAQVAGGYDSALPEQQVALSMLAAQELISALSLSVSAQSPREVTTWLTSRGLIELSAAYEGEQLKVGVVLPDGGQVLLKDGEVEHQSSRSQPGALEIVLTAPPTAKAYALEVSLTGETIPLRFALNFGH